MQKLLKSMELQIIDLKYQLADASVKAQTSNHSEMKNCIGALSKQTDDMLRLMEEAAYRL